MFAYFYNFSHKLSLYSFYYNIILPPIVFMSLSIVDVIAMSSEMPLLEMGCIFNVIKLFKNKACVGKLIEILYTGGRFSNIYALRSLVVICAKIMEICLNLLMLCTEYRGLFPHMVYSTSVYESQHQKMHEIYLFFLNFFLLLLHVRYC